MAKFVDKIKDFIAGPYDDEYEDDYDEYEDEDIEEYRPHTRERREVSQRESRERENVDYSAPRSSRRSQTQPQVVDFKSTQNTQQVVIMKPECYEDAQGICDNI